MVNDEIIRDILNYIDFLRSLSFSVTFCCIDSVLDYYYLDFINYDVHLPQICSYLKNNIGTLGKCINNKKKLKEKAPTCPYYSCCYAGVEEFVIPILNGGRAIMLISISGYRGRLDKSARNMRKTKELCTEDFPIYYEKLSTAVPDMDTILKITKPLSYMINELYKKSMEKEMNYTSTDKVFREALRFIYENYMNQISCADIAKAVNYSESYLRRIFLQKSKMSTAVYVNSVRLDRAAQCIRLTDTSISQVAFACGFTDSDYFSTAFKKKYGLSPLKYRKENREKNTSYV